MKILTQLIFLVLFFIVSGCGGSKSSEPITQDLSLITARPADGLHLVGSDINTALVVAGDQALIYSRYFQQSKLDSLLTIDLYGKTNGLHANQAHSSFVAVTGGFKNNVYHYKCANTQDAGAGCINDYQKRSFTIDDKRSVQRPSFAAVNNNYVVNDWRIQLHGNEVDFIINVDDGSSVNFDLTASSTEWGIYTLNAQLDNTKGIIVFYQLNDKSYFDLLFYNNQSLNINLNRIAL